METCSSRFADDVENMVADDGAESRRGEAERWEAQHIHLVPEWLKGGDAQAYQPQLVSLGPFHHADPKLLPMEEHKRRAVLRVVKRSERPLEHFIAAVGGVAEELVAAYGRDLDARWRKDEQGFAEMMLADGCFLLEIMVDSFRDYQPNDPVFSMHGKGRIHRIIRSDMLLIENQLPLLVLKKILGVVHLECPVIPRPLHQKDAHRPALVWLQEDEAINLKVLRFLDREHEGRHIAAMSLRPHPLDLYHGSLAFGYSAHGIYSRSQDLPKYEDEMMPSAVEMHEAGIKFSKSKEDKPLDIRFERGVLSMPVIKVVGSTKSLYLNLMAFERLNIGAGDLVTAYVILMDSMILSADDAAMLRSKGLLIGGHQETTKLFNGTLSRSGQLMGECRSIQKVQRDVKDYCREPWHKCRAAIVRIHFRNHWAFVSFLLLGILVQTIYTVNSCKSLTSPHVD